MSKTLWGILLLSFSFARNARRLFYFSILRRNKRITTQIEGLRVLFLFWVIIGNTFLYSFYSFPANFDKKKDIAQNYFFITLFNNEFAFDTLLFFSAFYTAYELSKEFDGKKMTTCSYILRVINFVIKMLFPIIIIIGIASVFILFSSGPIWGEMASQINETCDRYMWTHVIFISNLFPFENNISGPSCLPWLWFVSTEFQFFFICMTLTLVYLRRPFIASFITWGIGLASLIICTIIASVSSSTTMSQYDSKTFSIIFTKPWSRIFGYSLGLFFGLIMYEFGQKQKPEENRRFGWRIISWMENMNIYRRTLFIIFAFILIFCPSLFQWLILVKDTFSDKNSGTQKSMYILYMTLGKPIYFLGLIIVVIFCLLKKLKWITSVIGNYIW
jgi:hypothetical protein